ncbi:uncharacterized protein LOC144159866 [Haemaphysalis longicornis]
MGEECLEPLAVSEWCQHGCALQRNLWCYQLRLRTPLSTSLYQDGTFKPWRPSVNNASWQLRWASTPWLASETASCSNVSPLASVFISLSTTCVGAVVHEVTAYTSSKTTTLGGWELTEMWSRECTTSWVGRPVCVRAYNSGPGIGQMRWRVLATSVPLKRRQVPTRAQIQWQSV